ncbi:hypothetical protein GGF32_009551 [Allomyces javanicus]|nr:hypothetical protein GGF32_009551 [Allomyces javanicus]
MLAPFPPATTIGTADPAPTALGLEWDESDVEHDTEADAVWHALLEERAGASSDLVDGLESDDNLDQFFTVQGRLLISNLHARAVDEIGCWTTEINARIMAAQELTDELHGAPLFTPLYPETIALSDEAPCVYEQDKEHRVATHDSAVDLFAAGAEGVHKCYVAPGQGPLRATRRSKTGR